MKTEVLVTRLPADLTRALDEVCSKLGLRKNHVIENALRENIEDLLDADDLRKAKRKAAGYNIWKMIGKER